MRPLCQLINVIGAENLKRDPLRDYDRKPVETRFKLKTSSK